MVSVSERCLHRRRRLRQWSAHTLSRAECPRPGSELAGDPAVQPLEVGQCRGVAPATRLSQLELAPGARSANVRRRNCEVRRCAHRCRPRRAAGVQGGEKRPSRHPPPQRLSCRCAPAGSAGVAAAGNTCIRNAAISASEGLRGSCTCPQPYLTSVAARRARTELHMSCAWQ
jgi:hypothetical protein